MFENLHDHTNAEKHSLMTATIYFSARWPGIDRAYGFILN